MILANNLSVSIEGKQLISNVSMSIEPGKFSVIIGKNGAGKSTFFKCITGDIRPNSGEINIDGKNISSFTTMNLARIRAVMMQNLHLSFSFSALEVVLIGRFPHSNGFESPNDKEIALECMKQAGVEHLANRLFPTLSGGEQQRVQLARMLAQLWDKIENGDPCYLLLDEPLSSLDLSHQHSILNLVKKLAQKNVAILMILHDLNLAAQYADCINLMKDGRTFAIGTPHEVFKSDIIEIAFNFPVHILQHPENHCPLIIASNRKVESLVYSV